MQENGSDNSMMSREDARTCYEKILQLDPENTVAHIDLGDYWEQKGDYDTALKLYNRAITLLKRGVFYNSYAEECEEAFWSKSELLKTVGKTDEYYLCIAEGLRLCPESELLKTDPDKRAFCKGC
jgi:tetratricopeptide (TPR) repeat protein